MRGARVISWKAPAVLAAVLFVSPPHFAQAQSSAAAALGAYHIDVQCPNSGFVADDSTAKQEALQRSVKITLDTPGLAYQQHDAQSALETAAERAVWSQCAITAIMPGSTTWTTNVEDIGALEIWGAPSDGALVRLLLRAGPYEPWCLCWRQVDDVYARDQDAARTLEAQQQDAATEAQQRAASAQQQVVDQAQARQSAASWDAWWSNTWDTIKTLFWIAVVLYVIVWLFKRREAIARWYYFTFYPHPAEAAVHSAINSGTLLDGRQLAVTLGEVPPGNAVFRQVRFEQSSKLIEAMQVATSTRLRELQERAKEQYAQAAVQQTQAALGQAAIALEQAKAMLNASKRSAPG